MLHVKQQELQACSALWVTTPECWLNSAGCSNRPMPCSPLVGLVTTGSSNDPCVTPRSRICGRSKYSRADNSASISSHGLADSIDMRRRYRRLLTRKAPCAICSSRRRPDSTAASCSPRHSTACSTPAQSVRRAFAASCGDPCFACQSVAPYFPPTYSAAACVSSGAAVTRKQKCLCCSNRPEGCQT